LFIVIVEDDHHRMLVYRYLSECGVGEHKMRIVRSPSGTGSAEKWIRQAFVKEVSVYRTRQARAQTALIVVIDADTQTVNDRLNQLDQALRDTGKHRVDFASEQIARLVPKRNVETWILCLSGHPVEEETDYKRTRHDWTELIQSAANTLSQWAQSKGEPPKNCIDSLRHGVRELKRLRY